MDIESRFAEIAKAAENYGGRILFDHQIEALLRYWYLTGVADEGSQVIEPKSLHILARALLEAATPTKSES